MAVNIKTRENYVENCVGLATALNPYIGYQNSACIAKHCLKTEEPVHVVIIQEKRLTEYEIRNIVSLSNMTRPGYLHNNKH